MTEIKLRAYILPGDPTEGRYEGDYIVDVATIDFENKYITWFDGQWSREFPNPSKLYEISTFDEIKLLLYTGLKDKNGVEIYEGSIVRLPAYKGKYRDLDEPEEIDEIKWEEDTARFTCWIGGQFIPNESIEVIGNIHENPELLTKEQK